MVIRRIEKLEYAWDIEFFSPPKWMKDPFPWDWFFLAEKVKPGIKSNKKTESVTEFSSPVCYVGKEDFRAGFEDASK